MSFLEGVIINVIILAIITQGVYVLTGLTGLFSLGQASFVAVGAYTAGYLSLRFGWPFLLCLLAGVIMSVLISILIGLPSIRLRNVYFSLATIAFCYGMESILVTADFLGGAIGLIGVMPVTRWWHVTIALALVYLVVRFFRRSRYGRACVSVRTDEIAAQTYGVNAMVVKQIAFSLSAAIAGLAGGLYVFYLGYLAPDMFGVPVSSEYLINVFFGGLYSQSWVLIGTVLLSVLMELLRTTAELRMVIHSAIILAIIIFQPTGLYGIYKSICSKVRSLRKKSGIEGAEVGS